MKSSIDMRIAALTVPAIAALLMGGCAGMTTGSNTTSMVSSANGPVPNIGAAGTDQAPVDLSRVKTWSMRTAQYLGKAPDIPALAADTSDLMIVSPADLESKDQPLDKQLAAVRGKGPHRIILALLDAAHVTPSSALWNSSWLDSSGRLSSTAPAWLTVPAKTGGSEYRVQYWDSDWRRKLGDETDRLRKAGFDGVCLSGLSAYVGMAGNRPTSAVDMAALVENVAHDAREHASNFYVVPIDDAALIDNLDDKHRTDYLKSIDAVVAENVFYSGDKASDNDLNPRPDLITALDKYQYAHRPVFVIDSVTASDKVADFQERARARGYIPAGLSLTASTPAPVDAKPASTAPAPIGPAQRS